MNRRMGIYAVALASSAIEVNPLASFVVIPLMAVFMGSELEKSIYSPKFQRETAWMLLALAALEGFTGFAAGPVTSNIISKATFGLMTRGLGLELHLILIDPLALFFILHIASGIGLSLIRRGIRAAVIYKAIIPAALIAAFALIVYLNSLFFFG
ncbi:hypothetical protein GCM10007981_15380 [Thermocladium modestius]|uniref:Uncharacterized protein n=1 Tax=Thermocladium modestius TaxID=62609 RepID=A0A830GX17_9CREN|nr:hypothetical protein [Thermocladium modestius]GGP21859.1 hypothetical protein GCM10007981_15380 [Thermocladium modestius]